MSATLEKRIATALTSDISAADLASLAAETEVAITEADAVAEMEREKALDPIASPDAVTARSKMETAAFTRDRLRTILPRLKARHQVIAEQEYRAAWNADCDAFEVKRDALASELRELYPGFVSKGPDLFNRIANNDVELSRLHQARPSGVARHLVGAELKARGLENFSVSNPSIVQEIKLPDWEHSDRMVWPKHIPLNPVLIAPVVAGDPRQHSGDWWKVKEEEAHAVQERLEREAAEKEAETRTTWHGPRWWERKRA